MITGISYLIAGMATMLSLLLSVLARSEEDQRYALALAGLALCVAAAASMHGVVSILYPRH